jgi:hypothetical protein
LLSTRYGDAVDSKERASCYQNMFTFARNEADFATESPVTVVASPGRDRIFMGKFFNSDCFDY